MRRDVALPPWVIGLGVLVVVVVGWAFLRPPDLARQSQRLELEVGRLLSQAGVRESRLARETRTLARARGVTFHLVEKTYRIPARFSSEQFARDLTTALGPKGFQLLESRHERTSDGSSTVVDLGYRRYRLYRLTLRGAGPEFAAAPVVPAAPLPPLPKGRGKIAIVLDDWGYNRKLVPDVLALGRPVTLAILPHQTYSRGIAEGVQGSACEVILHMPMEPHDPDSPREPKILKPGMSSRMIQLMFDEALASVPFSRGVSNHQGSKATEDPALMRAVLTDLRRRRLLFLDSFVTDKTVCQAIAQQIRLPFAQRSVFLDNEATPQAVRQRLYELAEIALRTGLAVGIGHDKQVTIDTLRELIPHLEAQGIEFVRLSDVAQVQE